MPDRDHNPVIESDAELAYACCSLLHGRLVATASEEALLIYGIMEQHGLMHTVDGKMTKTKRITDIEAIAVAANG